MEKLSLDAFKSKFMDESKEQLLEELTGGILGACHCGYNCNREASFEQA